MSAWDYMKQQSGMDEEKSGRSVSELNQVISNLLRSWTARTTQLSYAVTSDDIAMGWHYAVGAQRTVAALGRSPRELLQVR